MEHITTNEFIPVEEMTKEERREAIESARRLLRQRKRFSTSERRDVMKVFPPKFTFDK